MKILKKTPVDLLLLLCLVVLGGCKSGKIEKEDLVSTQLAFESRVVEEINPESGFHHPGILQSKTMLDTMAISLQRGDELRIRAWDSMLKSDRGSYENKTNWTPQEEVTGFDNFNFKIAATTANSYALRWIAMGKIEDAEKGIEILNAWSSTLKVIKSKPGDNHMHERLMTGIHGGYWANAAELLRNSQAPWEEEDQERFKTMLREVFIPVIEITKRVPHYNGNWDLSMIWSSLAIAVFLDDRELFDENLEYLKNGKTNGSIRNYLLPSGQCQESGRDQTHAQMGLCFMSRACEIAWNQGIDLYDYEGRSLGKCVEYLASYNLGNSNLPFKVYPSPVGRNQHDYTDRISPIDRGKLHSMYELIYNHYHGRKSLDMPNTLKVLNKTRIEEPNLNNDGWNTLCFADID